MIKDDMTDNKPLLLDRLNRNDYETIIEIGLDEAGRGCFFGPIMAGAVLWPLEETWNDTIRNLAGKIKDSKKLSPKRRSEYANKIRELVDIWGVGIVSADEINENGIQWANREAFKRALSAAWMKIPKEIRTNVRFVVDGSISFLDFARNIIDNDYSCIEELVVEGDGKYLSVAAASILAKVAHDDWIHNWISANTELAERYDMAGSKGYGTAKHRAGLGKWGSVEGHRTLFVRNWIPYMTENIIETHNEGQFNKSSKTENLSKCLIKL
ncbi:MAG: ribonuclease HII [Actinobacteria bacterium]|nr:ribonuclease HII [Actinomycetota bacterium]